MEPLLDRLSNGEIIVADGAIGTILIQNGLKPGDCPESFNLDKPDILKEITKLYLKSEAEIIQTNTFGASPMKLSSYGLEEKTEEINQKAVSIVKRIVNGNAYISGSCGPTGGILQPYGDVEPDEIFQGFKRQIQALIIAGVDVICIETMISLQEATLAVKASKAVSPKTPVIATMTFDKTTKGYYTIMGVNVKEAAAGLEEAGADIIGSNCGNGIENMVEIAFEFKKVTSFPLIIRSNAGQPKIKNGQLFYPEKPEFFAEKIPELIDAGVAIIGGCCGTNPEYIRAIKKTVELCKK
ncbi:MAG: homocysteine S-methyltransferase family protein [Candidatus Marinimicrobia bacterium]|nr:homocysteine S-methyltransferase family protein [Candidatus Neomarinimicrobiota bacterium]